MPGAEQLSRQIKGIVRYLVEQSLVDDQNDTFVRQKRGGLREVTYRDGETTAFAFRDRSYEETYRILSESRSYNMRMIDGALIQMMYEFQRNSLIRHRLAFLPSPHLDQFQNFPEAYLADSLFADIVAREIVRFPMRFDFDVASHVEVEHPMSHLTLGQYKNCRIPVTSPLTPYWFASFVIRNFYGTESEDYANGLPIPNRGFSETISFRERQLVHVAIPSNVSGVFGTDEGSH